MTLRQLIERLEDLAADIECDDWTVEITEDGVLYEHIGVEPCVTNETISIYGMES